MATNPRGAQAYQPLPLPPTRHVSSAQLDMRLHVPYVPAAARHSDPARWNEQLCARPTKIPTLGTLVTIQQSAAYKAPTAAPAPQCPFNSPKTRRRGR